MKKSRLATTTTFLRLLSVPFFLLVAFTELVFGQSSAERAKRVLILYENESTLPAVVQVAEGLRASLHRHMPMGLELYAEYLDTVRFRKPGHIAGLVDFLSTKYSGVTFDVVVAGGPGALRFALNHRKEIGNNAPIVFGAVDDTTLRTLTLPDDVKGLISHFDVRKTVDLALTLQPDAQEIVIMTGSSDFDKDWKVTARESLTDSYRNIPVRYESEITIEQFKQVARGLSRNSILLVLNIFEDSDGRKFIPRDATQLIAGVSEAPMYSVYSSHFGSGPVGGYVSTFNAIGDEMGTMTSKVLGGDLSDPQTTLVKDGPLVDWQLIRKWGIDPSYVPKDAEILNYEMSPWEQYYIQILAMTTVMLLQAATIAALIVEHRRKLKLQLDLNLERLELAYLSRTSQLGELSGALAHELNQPLTSILSNAEAGGRLLEKDPVDIDEIRDIFNDIVLDDKRAATVITQLRRLMIRGETNLELIDLNHAASTTMALARSELLARQTDVDLILDMPDVPIRGNLAQLQQVILNLLLNATDAMAHLPPGQREVAIQTRKREGGVCELTVIDRGVGIAPGRHEEVFKPFVSSKKSSLGLGLAICRSIVQAHGGTLQFDENFDEGARAILTLPSA